MLGEKIIFRHVAHVITSYSIHYTKLYEAGWTIVEEPETADVIVVNTCSFIEDAVEESIEMILDLARYKLTGSCKRLVVAGCLPQRYREQIADQLPEVDTFIGTGAFHHIV